MFACSNAQKRSVKLFCSQDIFIEKGSSRHARTSCMAHCRVGSVKPVHFRRSSHPTIRSSVASIYSSQPTTSHVSSLDSRSWLETVLLFKTLRRRFSRSVITCWIHSWTLPAVGCTLATSFNTRQNSQRSTYLRLNRIAEVACSEFRNVAG